MTSVLAATILSTACLVGRTTHTLYLDPSGSVTWVVLEQEVRSDAGDPQERDSEEANYIDLAYRGEHPIGQALQALFPTSSRVKILRRRRPFTVVTEAHYDRLDHLAVDLLRGLSGVGTAELRMEGAQMLLELTIDVRATKESDDEGEEILHPLVGEPDDYRIVLTSGRFVDAVGFELQSRDTVAVPQSMEEDELEERMDDDGKVTLSLRWSVD
ncbi:MAG: hypothetical protein ACE5IK_13105 [Acidobacteriota bacterium]